MAVDTALGGRCQQLLVVLIETDLQVVVQLAFLAHKRAQLILRLLDYLLRLMRFDLWTALLGQTQLRLRGQSLLLPSS